MRRLSGPAKLLWSGSKQSSTQINMATGSLTSDRLHAARIPASHLPRQPVWTSRASSGRALSRIHSLGPYFYFSQLALLQFPASFLLFLSSLQPRSNTSSTTNSTLLLHRNTQKEGRAIVSSFLLQSFCRLLSRKRSQSHLLSLPFEPLGR